MKDTVGKPLFPAEPTLIIDRDEAVASSVRVSLVFAGITNVVTCSNVHSAGDLVCTECFSAVIFDWKTSSLCAEKLLASIRERRPDIPVVVLTEISGVSSVAALMRQGVTDYFIKPIDHSELAFSLKRSIVGMCNKNDFIQERTAFNSLNDPGAFARILTSDYRMAEIFTYIEAIAPTSLPVFICGETGTGKDLLAQAIHSTSHRTGRFVVVNTAGLDDQLFSDTLFGHLKGAYTSSISDRFGLVEAAAGGTLFLDEIGDLPAESQGKLLRLIQQREYYRLGEDSVRSTDTRFLFATNQDLEDLVEQGRFRQDLYFRLKAHKITVPPLRERDGDIRLLVTHFVKKAAAELGRVPPHVSENLFLRLEAYEFPGNIRELEGMVLDAVVRHGQGPLSPESFGDIFSFRPKAWTNASQGPFGDLAAALRTLESLPSIQLTVDALVGEALRRSGGNQTSAARMLGIGRSALNKRLHRRHAS